MEDNKELAEVDPLQAGLEALPENFVIPGAERDVDEAMEAKDEDPDKAAEEKDASEEETTEEIETADNEEAAEEDEEAPQEPTVDDFARIAEAENDIRKAKNELKTQAGELEKLQTHLQKQADQIKGFWDNFRANPVIAFKQAGVDLNKFLQDLAQGNIDYNVAVEQQPRPNSEVAELKNEINELKQIIQQNNTKDVISEYRNQTADLLDKPDYAVLKTLPAAVDRVFELALEHEKATGETLPPKVILDSLKEEWTQNITENMASNPEVRKLLGLPEKQPDQDQTEKTSQKKKGVRKSSDTLSNDMASPTRTTPEKDPDGPLTEDEELRRAAKLVTNDLWSVDRSDF